MTDQPEQHPYVFTSTDPTIGTITPEPAKPGSRQRKRYPRQTVLMVSTDVAELIQQIAADEGLTRAQVLRSLIHASLRRMGHKEFQTSDS